MQVHDQSPFAIQQQLLGVRKQSIMTDWRGEREPVASNATAEGRAQNRQVEITLSPPAQ